MKNMVRLAAGVMICGSLSACGGGSSDPFWGVRRQDKGIFASAMASSYKVRIGPFVPAVGLACSVTKSTVDYFDQRGCDALFEVRKIF